MKREERKKRGKTIRERKIVRERSKNKNKEQGELSVNKEQKFSITLSKK